MQKISISELSTTISRVISEALSKNNGFESWKNVFLHYANEVKLELEKAYLNKLGLHIQFCDSNTFGGEGNKWLALYGRSLNKLGSGIISISLNLPYFYRCMQRMGIADDNYEIEAQARITIGHEVGHALIDYFVDYYEGNSPAVGKFVREYWDGVIDEEEEAETFGECMASIFTGVYDCYILDVLNMI